MSELRIEHISPRKDSLNEGSFLLIQHTDRIPPHISLVHDGKYYSVSVSGVRAAVDFSSVEKNGLTKKIKTLIIELESIRFTEEAIALVFEEYGRLDDPQKSCLFPVIEVLNRSYGLLFESEFVFELIRELEKNQKIKNVQHWNMESVLNNNVFYFPVYGRKDIGFCISSLNEKEKV